MLTADPQTPADDTAIWRYMNLERFLALICSGTLHLARLDQFHDPWEGAWPKYILDGFGRSTGGGAKARFLRDPNYKKHIFANCWHISELESPALWAMYSGRAGIAIKSTVGKLKIAITDARDVLIGPVMYLDFETEGGPGPKQVSLGSFVPPFLKRKSFDHEKELRVVMMGDTSAEGHDLACNIRALIDKIYLSPESDDYDWLKPHVERLLEKFGLGGIPVEKSPLYAKPPDRAASGQA